VSESEGVGHDLLAGPLSRGASSPDRAHGGESAGLRLLESWCRSGLDRYEARRDELVSDGTSRLSPYLHYGCISALEAATRVAGHDGSGPFLRQLCWRDFHHQVTASFPAIARDEYRPRGDRWRHDDDDLQAWTTGTTGYPIVDAGMRQLRQEGWMHNRARLITASFLTKDLYIDWRDGARHFMTWLVDGDVANNSGNWQWVAGTGNDTRPNRVFNPLRQAQRFDPNGDYVRRYVPELAAVSGPAVHRPWDLDPATKAKLGYPEPIVDHVAATARLTAARRAR
jgi:deoxyribodipyrimidine photo-lyase